MVSSEPASQKPAIPPATHFPLARHKKSMACWPELETDTADGCLEGTDDGLVSAVDCSESPSHGFESMLHGFESAPRGFDLESHGFDLVSLGFDSAPEDFERALQRVERAPKCVERALERVA
jgi:peptidoglycan/xylan/chitin deacetylase (PgdA/CDA1 family)